MCHIFLMKQKQNVLYCVYEYNVENDLHLREKSNSSELKDLNELSTQEAASSTNNLEEYLAFTHTYAKCAIQTRKMEMERFPPHYYTSASAEQRGRQREAEWISDSFKGKKRVWVCVRGGVISHLRKRGNVRADRWKKRYTRSLSSVIHMPPVNLPSTAGTPSFTDLYYTQAPRHTHTYTLFSIPSFPFPALDTHSHSLHLSLSLALRDAIRWAKKSNNGLQPQSAHKHSKTKQSW